MLPTALLCAVAALPGALQQLCEKESNEGTLQKHQQQMRDELNRKLADCQEYRAVVNKLQEKLKEQEGEQDRGVLINHCVWVCSQPQGTVPCVFSAVVLRFVRAAAVAARCRRSAGPAREGGSCSTPAGS